MRSMEKLESFRVQVGERDKKRVSFRCNNLTVGLDGGAISQKRYRFPDQNKRYAPTYGNVCKFLAFST